MELLDAYVARLLVAAGEQNLIARSTVDQVWERHVFDSLQLLALCARPGCWADLGSGAGLPGLVIAIADPRPVTLIEPRRRRADFLAATVHALGLAGRVRVIAARCETTALSLQHVVSARAVAPLTRLFAMAEHFASGETQWLLPKGRSAAAEVAVARETWQGRFRLVPSQTEPQAAIIVADHVRRKGAA